MKLKTVNLYKPDFKSLIEREREIPKIESCGVFGKSFAFSFEKKNPKRNAHTNTNLTLTFAFQFEFLDISDLSKIKKQSKRTQIESERSN